jgi:hypothetical protein
MGSRATTSNKIGTDNLSQTRRNSSARAALDVPFSESAL